jgi:metacaspase-1
VIFMATNRRALCVGINNFKKYPNSALQGCVNDANDMEALLKKYMGYGASDIVKLTDTQATKANIIENLKEMVEGAKKGEYDSLVFSMSSHGTQVPDTSGDEPDKADEAFCPHDLAAKGDVWDPDHIIVDDELNKLFTQLPENVSLEVYLDTCHSGSGLKAIDMLLDRRPRFMPPPSLKAFEQVEGKESKNLLVREGATQHILWAACAPEQTSADANIAGGWHGAFTYFFCKEVNDSQNKLSRDEVLKKVLADLDAGRYTQVPQLECDATAREKNIG